MSLECVAGLRLSLRYCRLSLRPQSPPAALKTLTKACSPWWTGPSCCGSWLESVTTSPIVISLSETPISCDFEGVHDAKDAPPPPVRPGRIEFAPTVAEECEPAA